jgi:hypothetical protein
MLEIKKMEQNRLLKPLEEFIKHNKRSTEFIVAVVGLAVSVVFGSFLLFWSAHLDRQIQIRSHNLDVFYKSLTCDDLPLKGDTNVEACEQAIGKFMIEEDGLFTREELGK